MNCVGCGVRLNDRVSSGTHCLSCRMAGAGLEITTGQGLLDMMARTGKKWGVCVAEIDGKDMAIILTADGASMAMDEAMLEQAIPFLQSALETLRKSPNRVN